MRENKPMNVMVLFGAYTDGYDSESGTIECFNGGTDEEHLGPFTLKIRKVDGKVVFIGIHSIVKIIPLEK